MLTHTLKCRTRCGGRHEFSHGDSDILAAGGPLSDNNDTVPPAAEIPGYPPLLVAHCASTAKWVNFLAFVVPLSRWVF